MNEEQHPFQPGVKVAIVSHGYQNDVSYRIEEVAKVYKTGRFVLVGSSAQWRAYSQGYSSRDIWQASKTDRGFGLRESLQLITPDLIAAAAATKRRRQINDLATRLERLSRSATPKLTDADVLDINAIVLRLEAK